MWVQPLAFSISTLLIYSSTWWKRSEALKRKLPRALIVVFLFLLLVFKSHSLSFSVNLPQRPSNVKLATLWRLMPTLAVREATFQLWELTHKVAAKKKKAKVRHCNSLYLDVQRSSLVAPRDVKVNEKVIACRSRQCVLVLCTSSSVTSPPSSSSSWSHRGVFSPPLLDSGARGVNECATGGLPRQKCWQTSSSEPWHC